METCHFMAEHCSMQAQSHYSALHSDNKTRNLAMANRSCVELRTHSNNSTLTKMTFKQRSLKVIGHVTVRSIAYYFRLPFHSLVTAGPYLVSFPKYSQTLVENNARAWGA